MDVQRINLLAAATEQLEDAVTITTRELDPPGPEIVYVNEAFCRMTGYSVEEVIGESPRFLQGPKTDRAELDRLRRRLSGGMPFKSGEVVNYRKDGTEFVLEWHVAPLRDDSGEITHWVASQRDVTERKRREAKLSFRSMHDPLTGLPNRALLTDRLESAASRAERRGRTNAVLFMDLDNFKVFNDSLGHEAGDRLLISVAGRLGACLRAEDTLARWGGDEFIVLLEDIGEREGAYRTCERIAGELETPFVVGARELFVTASIGIAFGGGADGSSDLLRKADLAMYAAKAAGKSRYRAFEEAMNTRALGRLGLEEDLRRAVDAGELVLHYQPKVWLGTGKIDSFEALARWEHPTRGLLDPNEFIPIAEETGLIVPVGRWVLREACRQTLAWQEQLPAGARLGVCVNLSSAQFRHPRLVEDVAEILRETGLRSGDLTLEVTEGALAEEAGPVGSKLLDLKELGTKLAIDDFGKGFSSLSRLRSFPVDILKVDRSFTSRLGTDPDDEVLISGIVSLAAGLGVEVVAEGVETEEQASLLRKLGCKLAQGFHFAKPLPAGKASSLLAEVQ